QIRLTPLSWLSDHLPGPKAAGHPGATMELGDALGLDLYVASPNASRTGTTTSQRIAWKQEAVSFWSDRSAAHGKQLWITEMQAARWEGGPDFDSDDLLASA